MRRIIVFVFVLLAFPTLAGSLPASAASAHTVSIQGFAFDPEALTIAVGDTVIWSNDDFVAHNVAGGSFSSGNFASGTFEHTFLTPGEYSYLCTLHSGMTGTVTVLDEPGAVVPEASRSVLLIAAAVIGVLGLATGRRSFATAS